jgi:hypothetical protein
MKKLIKLLIATNVLVIFCLTVLSLLLVLVIDDDSEPRVALSESPTPPDLPGCPALSEPVEHEARFSEPNIITLLYTIPYSVDPEYCFEPHPNAEGRYVGGWTKIRVGTGDPDMEENTWIVYEQPSIREWDGTSILVGDIIDLYRMGNDFLESWDTYDRNIEVLYIEMHLEDLEGNSITLRSHGCGSSSGSSVEI